MGLDINEGLRYEGLHVQIIKHTDHFKVNAGLMCCVNVLTENATNLIMFFHIENHLTVKH